MQCETCGKDTELFLTDLEGAQLKLCAKCGRFGKILKRIKTEEEIKKQEKNEVKKIKQLIKGPEKELIQVIVEDYPERIKTARERLKLKQEDFAKNINEKLSLIHNLETGHLEPNLALARKLEKALNIVLIEDHEESHGLLKASKSDKLTIGDLIKVKGKG